jgi:plastocyanin
MRRIIVSALVTVAAIGLVGAVPTAAGASGGGGCGRAVSDARGTSVRIKNFCFLPTILRVRPGDAVTFDNRDGFAHVVLGANAAWGSFSQVRSHRAVTFRFVRTGVYPYVCTYHPGMVGAIVVGNGKSHGATTTATAAGPVITVTDPPHEARTITGEASRWAMVPQGSSVSRWVVPWQAVALVVFAVAVLGFASIERRRARQVTA